MKLPGVGADDLEEVWETVQYLFINILKIARSKRDSQQAKMHVDHLLFHLVDDMHSMWHADSFLDRAQELVEKHANCNTAELDTSRPSQKEQ